MKIFSQQEIMSQVFEATSLIVNGSRDSAELQFEAAQQLAVKAQQNQPVTLIGSMALLARRFAQQNNGDIDNGAMTLVGQQLTAFVANVLQVGEGAVMPRLFALSQQETSLLKQQMLSFLTQLKAVAESYTE